MSMPRIEKYKFTVVAVWRKLLLGGARRAISPCSTEQIHSKSVLEQIHSKHLGPPTEIYEVVASMIRATRKKFFTDRDIATIRILGTMYSRSWAHNLSARMGPLEVRGATMSPSRRTIPNS